MTSDHPLLAAGSVYTQAPLRTRTLHFDRGQKEQFHLLRLQKLILKLWYQPAVKFQPIFFLIRVSDLINLQWLFLQKTRKPNFLVPKIRSLHWYWPVKSMYLMEEQGCYLLVKMSAIFVEHCWSCIYKGYYIIDGMVELIGSYRYWNNPKLLHKYQ